MAMTQSCHINPVYSPSDGTINRGPVCRHMHQDRNYTHVKDTVVSVRVRWIKETIKHPACTAGGVAQLCRSWLSPGKATRISHGKNLVRTMHLLETSKKEKESSYNTSWPLTIEPDSTELNTLGSSSTAPIPLTQSTSEPWSCFGSCPSSCGELLLFFLHALA